jgi:hypothetical protein
MAFIAGKGFAILNSKAEQGDQKAKDLLAKLDSIDQEEADRLFSEILGKGGGGGSSKDKKVKAPGASATDGQGKITEGDGEQPPTGKTTPKKAGAAPAKDTLNQAAEQAKSAYSLDRASVKGNKLIIPMGDGDFDFAGYPADDFFTQEEDAETGELVNIIDLDKFAQSQGIGGGLEATSPAQTPLSENALFKAKLKLNEPFTDSDAEAWSAISGLSTDEVRDTYDKLKGTPAQSKTAKPADPLSNENLQALFDSGLDTDGVIDQVRTQMRDVQLDPNDPFKNSDLQGIVEGFETGYKPGVTNAPEGLVTDLDIERLGEELGISNQEARREYEKAGAQFDTANSVYQPDAKTLLETLSPEQPRLRTAEDARTQELLEFEPEQPAEVGTSFDNALERTGGNLSGDDARKLAEDYGISVAEVNAIADEYKAEQGTKPEKFSSVTPTFQEDPKPLYNDPEEAVRETLLFEGGSLSDGDKQGIADEFGISIDEVNQLIRKEQSTTPFRMEEPTPLPNEETQRQVAALDTEIERIRNTQYRNPDDAKNFVNDITNYESDGKALTESEFNYYASQNDLTQDEAEKAYQEYGDKVYDNKPYSWDEPAPFEAEEISQQKSKLTPEKLNATLNESNKKDFINALTAQGVSEILANDFYNTSYGPSRLGNDPDYTLDEALRDVESVIGERKFSYKKAQAAQPTRTVTGQQQVQGQGVKVPPTKETAAAPDRKKLEKAAEDLGVDPNLLEGLLELLKKVR